MVLVVLVCCNGRGESLFVELRSVLIGSDEGVVAEGSVDGASAKR